MIAEVGASPGTGAAQQYAGTMAGLWSGLQTTLHGLETLAADARRLDEDVVDALRLLQYRLHWSSEALAGVEPPAGARAPHEELAESLTEARDVTGEIAEAIELHGHDGARDLLLEWRGALFRVRLARMRLTDHPSPVPAAEPAVDFTKSAAAATALTFLGVAGFVAGAVLIVWPLWAAGLALVAGGFLIHRP
jgi:hypothetical protein